MYVSLNPFSFTQSLSLTPLTITYSLLSLNDSPLSCSHSLSLTLSLPHSLTLTHSLSHSHTQTIPENIRYQTPISLGEPHGEAECLQQVDIREHFYGTD